LQSADTLQSAEGDLSLSEPRDAALESVWAYPRPPRLEPTSSLIRIVHGGVLLAETNRALRILETSHPPVFYLPASDIALRYLLRSSRRPSFCEFKGSAEYWTVAVPRATSPDAAWSYPRPSPAYAALRDHLAFYANRVDHCSVDGETVQPQAGDFYGGWITSRVKGPFKGPPGTLGW
jgi:uncharacterized protein (DUF427 family)